ncbi:MAG: histidine phosphatase family protein [Actinomycetia bacterium]|nr:histidine phosphatase family protein [Actinomycetes bacterium]
MAVSSTAPTQLLLVRHGQSEWNALGRWQGQADPPLTNHGRVQAAQAGEKLGMFDAIASSPQQRALETATILAQSIGVGPVLVDDDLRERGAGEWSGLTRVEIDSEWPGYLDEGRRPPAFEADEPLLDRVTSALLRLGDRARGGQVLVVCHGGVIGIVHYHHGERHRRIPNLGAQWVLAHSGQIQLGDEVELIDPEPSVDSDDRRV